MRKLFLSFKKCGGRNNSGTQTVFTQGGGVKRKYRFIDFQRKLQSLGFVLRIEKDPYRSAFISLVCYTNGVLAYIIAVEKFKVGSVINNGNFELKIGSVLPLSMLSNGSIINNVEMYPGNGSIIARSAGTWIQIIKQFNASYTQVKLRSGEHRLLHNKCRAVYGITSNIYHNQIKLSKAGQTRLLGLKPKVRGIAMNPVDHPNGGRTNGGMVWKTPWGKLAKFSKTRITKSKTNIFIVVKRNNISNK